jgi:hypothetical protein
MYFKRFPRIEYKTSGNRFKESYKFVIAVDITAATRIVRGVVNDIVIYDKYAIRDTETPEVVAELLWNQPQWHWIILLLNDIFHPSDWPLNNSDFNEMIVKKYGSFEEAAAKVAVYFDEDEHIVLPQPFDVTGTTYYPNLDYTDEVGFSFVKWTDEDGLEVEQPSNAFSVAGLDAKSFLDYEVFLNERKREIRIVDRQVADYIASQYRALMG